jgi:catechol 2,3-dioxygenase-like lactoylglutathione lyase family enzyme
MPTPTRLITLVPIRKMNRAVKFYTEKLGAKVVMRGTGAMKELWSALSLAGSDIWLVHPSVREKRKLAYQTLLVPDIKKFVRALQTKGVKFDKAERTSKDTRLDGPIAHEGWGSSAYFRDPEGNLLMVWQNPPM